jgi:GntR family transcriptional repressor for pyruvate dehydrogenase complex
MNLGQKNYEIVAEELQRMIQNGTLQPGQRVETIENLAKQYRVGRSTIREALSYLKAHGLIESKQGGGTFVSSNPIQNTLEQFKSSNQEDLLHLLQVRSIVEVGCIELAAKYRTPENIQELMRILVHLEDAIDNEEMSQLYDTNFHLAIAKATQNPFLQTMMEGLSTSLRETMQISRRLWLKQETHNLALVREHQDMFQAIISQDAAKASTLMKQHLDQVIEALQN